MKRLRPSVLTVDIFWLVFPAISKEALATHELTRPAEGASLLHEAAPSLLPAVHEALQRKPTEPGGSANVTELMAKGVKGFI